MVLELKNHDMKFNGFVQFKYSVITLSSMGDFIDPNSFRNELHAANTSYVKQNTHNFPRGPRESQNLFFV